MKKVSILSFPRYFNYGTFLQLYAMQTTVAGLGYQPELIDYDPYNDSGRRNASRIPGVASIGKLPGLMRSWFAKNNTDSFTVSRLRQRRQFERFLSKQLALGHKTYFTAEELEQDPPASQAVIVGSDQVWHPVGHRKDPAYFLSFAQQQKRVAYAPSFGVSEVPTDTHAWLAEHIANIPYLSVREQAGAGIIKALTGRDARVVLDPAYLLEPKQWDRFAGSPVLANEPYMLCYFLESDRYMRETALRIARERGLKPIMIPVHSVDGDEGSGFVPLSDIGPQAFVALIRDADFVCTDSFHGTTFAILFNRQFLTFKRYDNPAQAANHSRLESVLQVTGLEDRVADQCNCQNVEKSPACFAAANRAVAALREDSLAFLRDSLQRAIAA